MVRSVCSFVYRCYVFVRRALALFYVVGGLAVGLFALVSCVF